MILRALTKFTAAEPPTVGYGPKQVGFELVVRRDGSSAALWSNYVSEEKGRARAPDQLVPTMTRSNNPPPLLACDTASFVLGRVKEAPTAEAAAKEQAKATAKNDAFVTLLSEYGAETGDRDPEIFAEWTRAGRPGLAESIGLLSEAEQKRLDLDLISVRVEGSTSLHAKPAAMSYWADLLQRKGGGPTSVCLVCGRVRPTVDTLPQSLVGSRIPATSTAQVALLSVNFESASRGARGKGLRSAPICMECAISAVSSFNALTASPTHRWGNSGDQFATIWWTSEARPADENDVRSVENPSPAEVQRLYESAYAGKPSLYADDRFYLLTFRGNVARLVILRWLDLPLSQVRDHLRAWFRDTKSASPDHPYWSLTALASSAGPFTGDKASVPPGAVNALALTAVGGVAPPRALLLQALQRARAEVHGLTGGDALTKHRYRQRRHARAGLLRLLLNRSNYKEKIVGSSLDESRTDPPYVNGRLFAIREALQYRASGEVNASIVDRFFERASANPQSVQHSLETLGMRHLRALRGKENGRGPSIWFAKRIQDLERLGEAPGRLSPEQQAAWFLGYYQQREFDFAQARQAKDSKPMANATTEEKTQ